MSKLRFGICGLGFMGRAHYGHLLDHPRAEVIAVCDQDPARRRGQWESTGNLALGAADGKQASLAAVRSYSDPRQLIGDPDVEAVIIALPTALHAEVAVSALRAGKHVLCEKPMAIRVGDCDRMIQASQASHRTLMVAHCIRFWPQYELIKSRVDEGRIGPLRFVTLRRLGLPPTYSAGNWLLDARQSGGAILDLHIHDIDFAQYLLGLPQSIRAWGTRGPSGGVDHVVAAYNYDHGRYAIIEGGWMLAAPWQFDMEITVHGEHGTLGWALSRGSEVCLVTANGATERIACTGDAVRNELDYFIDCVQADAPVARCLPSSSRASVVLSWLERRSIETQRPIIVSDRLQSAWATRLGGCPESPA